MACSLVEDERLACRLLRPLYGHPAAGGYWERRCEKHLRSVGFSDVRDQGWRNCCWRSELKRFLVVYADDVQVVGPVENLEAGWKVIRKGLAADLPADCGKYPGCSQHRREVRLKSAGKVAQAVEYDMDAFFRARVGKYTEVVQPLGEPHRLTKFLQARTPFLTTDPFAPTLARSGPRWAHRRRSGCHASRRGDTPSLRRPCRRGYRATRPSPFGEWLGLGINELAVVEGPLLRSG